MKRIQMAARTTFAFLSLLFAGCAGNDPETVTESANSSQLKVEATSTKVAPGLSVTLTITVTQTDNVTPVAASRM